MITYINYWFRHLYATQIIYTHAKIKNFCFNWKVFLGIFNQTQTYGINGKENEIDFFTLNLTLKKSFDYHNYTLITNKRSSIKTKITIRSFICNFFFIRNIFGFVTQNCLEEKKQKKIFFLPPKHLFVLNWRDVNYNWIQKTLRNNHFLCFCHFFCFFPICRHHTVFLHLFKLLIERFNNFYIVCRQMF